MALHWATVANLVGATGATGPTGPTGPTGATTSYRTTFSSFTVPAVGSTVNVTVAATADFVVGQRHVLTDGTLYIWAAVTTIASLVVTYTNLATPGGAVSGSMGAGRVYMATGGPILGTSALLNVPASGNATTAQVVLGTDTRLSDSRTPTGHQSTHVGGTDAIPVASSSITGLCPVLDNATIGITSSKLAVLAIPESAVTNLATDLTAKALKTTTITAGDGMSGGGDLSANRSLAVDGTVIRSTDSRLTDARVPIMAPLDLLLSSAVNLSRDCAGATGVHITLTITATLTLTLTHVSPSILVFLRVFNSTGGALTIGVAATNPSGTAYTVTSKNTAGGAEINMNSGQSIGASVVYTFFGSAGLADGHLSFLAL